MASLKDFFNKISNDNRIFTREDIGGMSTDEFRTNEKAIDYQLANLGVPTNSDLANSDDVIYVQAYTKDDGTKVKAHYRSKPDGVRSNNSSRSTIDDYSKAVENVAVGTPIKHFLDAGINIIGSKTKQYDAVNFWNIASQPFWINNNDYISKNGKLYNSINDLDNEYSPYKTKIKEKVKSQLKKEDVSGIVFHENSTVANAISDSKEIKDFVSKNSEALYSGKTVSGSWNFMSDKNLHNAFGKIEVLSAKLKNNNIEFILLDTYDFNPNDLNPIVNMGYSVQQAGLLNPYYTIVKCKYKL